MATTSPSGSPPDAGGLTIPAVIDHVAHAAERWQQTWPRYVEALGGQWASGGLATGFAPSQLRFANGARLEVLAPNDTESNPFLRRYLDRHGPGPHHLTFKVPDLDAALDTAARRGLQAINVDRSDPDWQEAFIHPHQASGIVVQLAQATGSWESPAPEGFPEPGSPAAALVRATHAVADLDAAVELFAGLLGGTLLRRTAAPGLDVVDVTWAAPLALRLVGPTHPGTLPAALAQWLAGTPGRLHHVVFSCPDPGSVPGAAALSPGGGSHRRGDGSRQGEPGLRGPDDELLAAGLSPVDGAAAVVAPEDNFGLRLVLTSATP